MAQKRLRILFDAHPLIGKKSGVGYYTHQLIEHMARQYADEIEFVGYYHNFLFRKPAITAPRAANIRYRTIALFPGQVVNLLRRLHLTPPIELLTLTRADFILYPNYLGLPSLFNTPNAPVIHDLTFVDHPETMSERNLHDLTRFVPGMLQRASFVITVSNVARQRLQDVFKVPADDVYITHIPPGKAPVMDPQQASDLLHKQSITKLFILFVGTIEPRKNLIALLEAYTLLPARQRQQYDLVIVGKIDWKYAETQQRIQELQSAGHNIHYLGYVDDDTRTALYTKANLFVFPPFYEGFGMPILEAFSFDVPCAISDIPVFHEVAGSAAAYFDPHNHADIAKVISHELTQPSISSAARRQQLASFSWPTLCTGLYSRIKQATGTDKPA
jgi:glycosyltransferase involved in cell wall biosynthesis